MAEQPSEEQIERWQDLVLRDAGIRQLRDPARNILETLLVDLVMSAPVDRADVKQAARVALLAETEVTLADRRGAPGWRALTENEAQTIVDACELYAVPA